MLKNIFKIVAIFVIGAVGGIAAEQILWPYFVERPLFYQYNLEPQPIYVTEKKQITITENVALQEAVEKVEKTVIGVRSKSKAGQTLTGSGLVITSDGLVVTLASLVPRGSDFHFWVDGKWPKYQILRRKRDLKSNLALIKIEREDLPTVGFADLDKKRLGERVFLVGTVFTASTTGTKTVFIPNKIVNQGIIKSLDEDLIQTNIFETEAIQGSPLFDIKGNLVGLNLVSKTGQVSAIPVTTLREFTNL